MAEVGAAGLADQGKAAEDAAVEQPKNEDNSASDTGAQTEMKMDGNGAEAQVVEAVRPDLTLQRLKDILTPFRTKMGLQ